MKTYVTFGQTHPFRKRKNLRRDCVAVIECKRTRTKGVKTGIQIFQWEILLPSITKMNSTPAKCGISRVVAASGGKV